MKCMDDKEEITWAEEAEGPGKKGGGEEGDFSSVLFHTLLLCYK